MKPRRLKLDSGIWRFFVEGVLTTIWTPSGKRHSIPNWCISGPLPGVHHCSDGFCTGHGHPVTPGNLRKYIEDNLL